ncbi:DUF2269 family protein [Pseudomonas cremoricolorata]|uniref:Membrane protein n=1 Tax=Pseudomonas cremoricolorata TaxID=157783 RepID=A0A089YA00_9PSED|nr:DUF2269 family protein [Pseudomonas cremoricolorata]AIR88633.1 membrane protein [Pseudomonas cremoricolorata]
MDLLTTLKTVHIAANLLAVGSALGLGVWAWRARQQAGAAMAAGLLRGPLLAAWLLLVLSLLSMPFSGWWLVHLVGWPLGQAWLLASSTLYGVAAASTAWLLLRLYRQRRGASARPRLTLALALFSALCFVLIAALMGAKPV